MSRFMIVVDTQRDFMVPDGALYVVGAEALVVPMNEMLASLGPVGTVGVLRTLDTHEPNATRAPPRRGRSRCTACVRDSAVWNTVLDVATVDPEIQLYIVEQSVSAMWEEADVTIRDARDLVAAPVPRGDFFDRLRAEVVLTRHRL